MRVAVFLLMACWCATAARGAEVGGWSGSGSVSTSGPASQPAMDFSKDTTPRSAIFHILQAIEDADEKALADAIVTSDPKFEDSINSFLVSKLYEQKLRNAAHE